MNKIVSVDDEEVDNHPFIACFYKEMDTNQKTRKNNSCKKN